MPKNEELGQAQQDLWQAKQDALWSTPKPEPSQSMNQMTGGFFGFPSLGPNSAVAAVQQQQQMHLQAYAMNHVQLQAYAQGVPGASSPVNSMSDPRLANYALQNMNQMNPYMADFLSRSQGASGMNLAPAQYMTSPHMGVFRNQMGGQVTGPGGARSFFRDIGTISGYRSFAPYEDPMDEQYAAQRRQTMRKESAVGGVISAANVGIGLFGGPVGLAYSLVGAPVVDATVSSYFERRAETQRIFDLSKKIATSNGSGFRRQGFSMNESSDVMSTLRKESANNVHLNMGDYMSILETGTDTGLFAFQKDAGGTTRKVKEYAAMMDSFMRLAGDPDVRSAMERMANLQSLGFASHQMTGAVSSLKGFARMAGTSVDNIMSGSGAYGAQMAVSQGGPASFGMMVGGLSQATVRGMVQNGSISELNLSLAGGESGLAQTMTQFGVNEQHTTVAANIASFSKWDGKKWTVDNSAVRNYLSSGKVNGRDLTQNTYNVLGGMDTATKDQLYIHAPKLTAEVLHNMNPEDQIGLGRARFKEFSKNFRQGTDRNVIAKEYFGDQWQEGLYGLSDKNRKDVIRQQLEAMNTEVATKRKNQLDHDMFWNKLGIGFTQKTNAFMENLDFKFLTEGDDEKAATTMGQLYLRGADRGMSANEANLYRSSGISSPFTKQSFSDFASLPFAEARKQANLSRHVDAYASQGGKDSTYRKTLAEVTAAGGSAHGVGPAMYKKVQESAQTFADIYDNLSGTKLAAIPRISTDEAHKMLGGLVLDDGQGLDVVGIKALKDKGLNVEGALATMMDLDPAWGARADHSMSALSGGAYAKGQSGLDALNKDAEELSDKLGLTKNERAAVDSMSAMLLQATQGDTGSDKLGRLATAEGIALNTKLDDAQKKERISQQFPTMSPTELHDFVLRTRQQTESVFTQGGADGRRHLEALGSETGDQARKTFLLQNAGTAEANLAGSDFSSALSMSPEEQDRWKFLQGQLKTLEPSPTAQKILDRGSGSDDWAAASDAQNDRVREVGKALGVSGSVEGNIGIVAAQVSELTREVKNAVGQMRAKGVLGW